MAMKAYQSIMKISANVAQWRRMYRKKNINGSESVMASAKMKRIENVGNKRKMAMAQCRLSAQ
jgi:hypothetical protein